jgi:hypothetical protein
LCQNILLKVYASLNGRLGGYISPLVIAIKDRRDTFLPSILQRILQEDSEGELRRQLEKTQDKC